MALNLSSRDSLKTKVWIAISLSGKAKNLSKYKSIWCPNNPRGCIREHYDKNLKISKGNKLTRLICNSFCLTHHYRAQSQSLLIWICLLSFNSIDSTLRAVKAPLHYSVPTAICDINVLILGPMTSSQRLGFYVWYSGYYLVVAGYRWDNISLSHK